MSRNSRGSQETFDTLYERMHGKPQYPSVSSGRQTSGNALRYQVQHELAAARKQRYRHIGYFAAGAVALLVVAKSGAYKNIGNTAHDACVNWKLCSGPTAAAVTGGSAARGGMELPSIPSQAEFRDAKNPKLLVSGVADYVITGAFKKRDGSVGIGIKMAFDPSKYAMANIPTQTTSSHAKPPASTMTPAAFLASAILASNNLLLCRQDLSNVISTAQTNASTLASLVDRSPDIINGKEPKITAADITDGTNFYDAPSSVPRIVHQGGRIVKQLVPSRAPGAGTLYAYFEYHNDPAHTSKGALNNVTAPLPTDKGTHLGVSGPIHCP